MTGGWHTQATVSRYTMAQGWVEDLPTLNQGRYDHGCAAFAGDNGQVLLRKVEKWMVFCLHLYFQNFLVAGGSNGYHLLDSTEVFRDGVWTVVAPLPVALEGVRGVTLDNTVFMTGVCAQHLFIMMQVPMMILQVAPTAARRGMPRCGGMTLQAEPGPLSST